MKWIGQHIYDLVARFRKDVHITGRLTLDTNSGGYLATGRSITPGDGGAFHIDAGTVIDNATSGSGTAALYAHAKIEQPTISAANNSVTVTDAATLYIAAAPSAGDNVTITNDYALWIDAGDTRLDGDLDLNGRLTMDGVTFDVNATGAVTIDGDGTTITNPSDSGQKALTIDNNDIDEVCLQLDAANTTSSILNVAATALTTANAVYINCDALTTGKALRLDVDDALTASATKTLLDVDYDKAGVTASGQTSATTGISVNMADAATNNADGAVTMIGAQIDVDSANAQGTITQKGLVLNVAADGTADTATTSGIEMEVVDGGTDIKMMSHADTADYCTIATTTNGATTITTVDGGAALAHFEVAADGDITLDAAGTIKLEGPVRPTGQIQLTHSSFTSDIDTTKTYMAFNDGDSENTASNHVDLPLIAPVAGKLLRVNLRANQDLSGKPLTWRLETQATGVNFTTGPTIVGTQSGAGCTNTSLTTYDFTSSLDSGDNLIDAGDAVFVSIQSNASTASTKFYITCTWEWDFSGI